MNVDLFIICLIPQIYLMNRALDPSLWLIGIKLSLLPWSNPDRRLWSRAPGTDSSQQCTSDPPPWTVQQSWMGRVRLSFQQRVMRADLYSFQCSGTFFGKCWCMFFRRSQFDFVFIYTFSTPHSSAEDTNLGAPKVAQETWKFGASGLHIAADSPWLWSKVGALDGNRYRKCVPDISDSFWPFDFELGSKFG